MDIGFIGLGAMGFPMARRLVEAGHRLFVHDVRRDAVDRLTRLGAEAAASPQSIADTVEDVFASLPAPETVLEVAAGPNGVSGGRKVRRFVDLSTTGATMAKRVAAALKQRAIVQIDAPVSGGVGGAEKGTLAVMVSGPVAEIERVRAVLNVIGKVFVVGDRPGMGQTMKLANNLLSATALAASSEAIVMGVKAGLDPGVMVEVINAGTGRNSATQDKFPRAILPRTFDFGFTNALMLKDLRLCLAEADSLGVPLQVADVVRRMFQSAADEFGADKDFTTVVRPLERRTGVEVKSPGSKSP